MKPGSHRTTRPSQGARRGTPRNPALAGTGKSRWGIWVWVFGGVALVFAATLLTVSSWTRSKTGGSAATTVGMSNGPALAAESANSTGPASTARFPLPDPLTLTNANDAASLGTALVERGWFTNAAVYYRRALELSPGDEEVHFNLAFAYSRMGRNADAIRHYSEALRIFPDHAEAHHNLGNVLTRQRRFDEGMKHLSKSLELQPENSATLNDLGMCLALQGKPKEAVQYFSDALRLQTNFMEARFNLANAFLASDRFAEAIHEFQTVLQVQPNFRPALQALATARQRQAAAAKKP